MNRLDNESIVMMRKIGNILCVLLVLCASCKQGGTQEEKTAVRPVVTVSIEPLRFLTEAVAGDRFRVETLVPKGSSPEAYDPTPRQLAELAQSKACLLVGHLGFERSWAGRMAENAPHVPFIDTSRGIDFIFEEGHSHVHHHGRSAASAGNWQEEEAHQEAVGEGMNVEPHVWNSPVNARIMAGHVLETLCALDKEHTPCFRARYDSLCRAIDRVDSLVRSTLAAEGARQAFLIYHPALSYFARDYGLHQISIEMDGKEPSPARLKQLIETCRREGVKEIFVQPEFDRRNAELVAAQTGARVVPVNPLSYAWEDELLKVAESLSQSEVPTP